MAEQQVVLDTDFINGITSYQAGDGSDLFCRVFRTLNKCPVVHPYVAENELMHNSIAQELIANGILSVIPYDSFLPLNGANRILYINSFHDIHKIILEEYVPRRDKPEMVPLTKNEDIFARCAGRSFGEIHSILMAAELGIPLFYSNDSGAKTAVSRFAAGRLIVQNATEVAKLLKTEGSEITGKERRFIKNFYERK